MLCKYITFLTVVSLLLVCTMPPQVGSTFPHALGGLVTDIAVHPLKFLALLFIKKLILLKLGFLLLGKRSIDGPASGLDPTTDTTAADYERMATQLDENGCVAKLICEIMAGNQDGIQEGMKHGIQGGIQGGIQQDGIQQAGIQLDGKFERAVEKYFRSLTAKQLTSTSPSAPGHSIFHYAAFMGKLSRRTDSCALIFQKCTSNMSAVRKTANAAFELDI